MTKPFFSVVIPLYNKAPYILRAVNSVLNQTFQDYELIVVDDGSTDRGGELVKKIPDTRIRLIKQNNSGVSSARNRGIQEAKSDYVAFLDADDEWKERLLECFIELIEEYPDYVLYGQSFYIKDKKKLFEPKLFNRYHKNYKGTLIEYLDLAPHGQPFFPSSVCIPIKKITYLGGFPENVALGEDLTVWLELYLMGNLAFCNSFNAIYYLDNKDNISTNLNLDFGFFEQKLEYYLNKAEIDKITLKSLYEYYTSRILVICTQKLLLGKQKECRNLLSKCKKTEKQKIRWGLKLIYSYLPTKIFRFLYTAIKN